MLWSNGRKLQNTLNKGDLIGGAAERIDHSAKRRGGTSSWKKSYCHVDFLSPGQFMLVVAFNFKESESK